MGAESAVLICRDRSTWQIGVCRDPDRVTEPSAARHAGKRSAQAVPGRPCQSAYPSPHTNGAAASAAAAAGKGNTRRLRRASACGGGVICRSGATDGCSCSSFQGRRLGAVQGHHLHATTRPILSGTLCSAALTFVCANCLLIKGCADQVRICRGPIALPSYRLRMGA